MVKWASMSHMDHYSQLLQMVATSQDPPIPMNLFSFRSHHTEHEYIKLYKISKMDEELILKTCIHHIQHDFF